MERDSEFDRRHAMQRHAAGESPSAIAASMGYSRKWLYKWLRRSKSGGPDWFRDHSRRPHQTPARTGHELEELVILVRRKLADEGLFHGAQAIRWELEDLDVLQLPSVRTIGNILARHDLVRRRSGRYEPKGKRYPAPIADGPGAVHQSDFIGPCYLRGPIRFYSLNTVDISTGRCAVQPMLHRAGQQTVSAVWETWCRLGMPRHHQVDNEMVFYGSPAHPRGLGMLIRLCLLHGIEPWFIPCREPWRNGVVEKFNDHWRAKFLRAIVLESPEALHRESLRFEQRHNSRYRYSKLGGKTPQWALQATGTALRFPPTREPPRYPLPKPDRGRYHLVRFVRSEAVLDVFGERFLAPPEAVYEYVRLTVDVERQRLSISLNGTVVDEREYRLR